MSNIENCAPSPLSPLEERSAKKLVGKIGRRIKHDAYVIGIGEHSSEGTLKMLRLGKSGVTDKFITEFLRISHRDVASRLFSCNATSVFAIDVLTDYPSSRRTDAGKVGGYLKDHDVLHLLLAGIDSRYGVAWLTLFRKVKLTKEKFSLDETELASYLVRAALYGWQKKCKLPISNHSITESRYKPLGVPPAALGAALRLARGFSAVEIGLDMGISEPTALAHVNKALALLGTREEIADRLYGPLPKISVRPSYKNVPRKKI